MYDPFITVWPVTSPSFLPILFQPPGSVLSIHVAIYLPTAGQDAQFLNELSNLSSTLDEILETHPESPIYLRGYFNVSHSNTKMMILLDLDPPSLSNITPLHEQQHIFP